MQQSVLGERNVGLSTVVSDKTGNCATIALPHDVGG